MSKTFNDLPLAARQLDEEDAARLIANLAPLRKWLNCPGDWGYGTKLGNLFIALLVVECEAKAILKTRPEEQM